MIQRIKLVLGDLDARVDWGYAPDYVDAMFRILQLPEASDFVVASGEMHTVREFAQVAFGALGLDWRRHVETDARLLNKISHPLRGDCGKLRAATGWSPTIGFAEMVARLVHEAAERLPNQFSRSRNDLRLKVALWHVHCLKTIGAPLEKCRRKTYALTQASHLHSDLQ